MIWITEDEAIAICGPSRDQLKYRRLGKSKTTNRYGKTYNYKPSLRRGIDWMYDGDRQLVYNKATITELSKESPPSDTD